MIRVDAAGAIAKIGLLRASLEKLARVPRRTAVIAAPLIDKEIKAEFDAGRDPYGKPWADLRPATLARGRRPPPLTDSRDLRDNTKAIVLSGGRAGIHVVIGAAYGYFAQVGFRVGKTRVPPRRILPAFGLPKAWLDILADSAERAAREAMK